MHLHRRTNIEDIQMSFSKYYWKLVWTFLGFKSDWVKYAQPLNMTKAMYGEKMAFEYAYLVHYQAWLLIATFGGLCLFGYQCYWWVNVNQEFTWLFADTQYNVIYCVFIVMWACLFLVSWKRVQNELALIWGCTTTKHTAADERDEFKFYEAYNETTGTIEKKRREMSRANSIIYPLTYYGLLFLNILVMGGYLGVMSFLE
jgi:hypothetical protein